jgi:uncharacterized protein (DUF1330 family)
MILVATLMVRPGAENTFRDYERKAAAIMARHGARIERTVTLDPNGEDQFFREIHVVYFPGAQALDAYREDPDFKALAVLRESCIVATEIRYGENGPDYHAPMGA